MRKHTHFSGQPIFSQLLSLIPASLIRQCASSHQSDRYYKKFKSSDHLTAMLFCAFARCQSLREVTCGLQVWQHRLNHLGLNGPPRRSTLADANARRPVGFFADLFNLLYRRYYRCSPDSRPGNKLLDRIFLMDSTTITLFQEIMKAAGRSMDNGKRKGGAKAHVLINAREDVPQLVMITSSSRSDKLFMPKIDLPAGSILVFDRGYLSYGHWIEWNEKGITWVTREHARSVFEEIKINELPSLEKYKGVLRDEIVRLGHTYAKDKLKLEARRITFRDPVSQKVFVFMTNNRIFPPSTIAAIYKQRWQIELLFKRIKQNYPLKYFLGDNENAIRIQIWCSLICDLLLKILKDTVKRRRWSYSNLASIIRLHLGTYVNLSAFLNNPEKAIEASHSPQTQLFPT